VEWIGRTGDDGERSGRGDARPVVDDGDV